MERRHFLKLAFGFAAGGMAPDAAAAGRRRRAPWSGCQSGGNLWRRGRSSQAGRSALGPWPSSRLGPPSWLGPSSLGLAPPSLGLAPPSLASPPLGLAPSLLAPPLLVRPENRWPQYCGDRDSVCHPCPFRF